MVGGYRGDIGDSCRGERMSLCEGILLQGIFKQGGLAKHYEGIFSEGGSICNLK